jgi:hypothetical protein
MKRSNLLIAVYLVLIFGSGAVVGAFASRLIWAPPVRARLSPEEYRRQYVNEMQGRLHLTTDQSTKLNEILDDTGAKVHNERERHNQAMKAIHDEQMNRVRAILTDAQRPEYEKLREEREQRARKAQGQGQRR